MPGFDGTGPNGLGAKTGGQRGMCTGANNNQAGFFGFMRNCLGF